MALWQARLDRTKLAWAHEQQWSGQGLGIVVEPQDQRRRYVLVFEDAAAPSDEVGTQLAQALGDRRIADARPDPPQWAASLARALLLPSYTVHDDLLACAGGGRSARVSTALAKTTSNTGSHGDAISCGCGGRFKQPFKPALESPAGRATATVGGAVVGSLGTVFTGLGGAVVNIFKPRTKTTAVEAVASKVVEW